MTFALQEFTRSSDHSVIEISASTTGDSKKRDHWEKEFKNNRQFDVVATIFANKSINSSLLNEEIKIFSSSHFGATQTTCDDQIKKKITFYGRFSTEASISCLKSFEERKASTSCSNELQVKEKIMYSSNNLRTGVIDPSRSFWQRETSFSRWFLVSAFDCAFDVIVDEYDLIMREFSSLIKRWLSRSISRIWNKVDMTIKSLTFLSSWFVRCRKFRARF